MKTKPMSEEDLQFVKKVLVKLQFFNFLNKILLEKILSNFETQSFEPNEVVCRQGSAGDAFYIIKTGKLTVSSKTLMVMTKQLAVLGPGEVFGEMSLISKENRNATVTTLTAAEIFVLKSSTLQDFVQSNLSFKSELKQLIQKRKGK